MATIEMAKSAVLLNDKQFKADFYEWLVANFHIFEYFERCAQQVRENGFQHYSARTIVEVMRHRSNVREIGDGSWKLNDHLLHPDHDGLFAMRSRQVDAKMGEVAA